MSAPFPFITPDWPAPANVRAACTTRGGGVSVGPYASLNLGTHVGDAPEAVAANRARLRTALGLPAEPCWLEQVHGVAVADAQAHDGAPADACIARGPGAVCVVMTADCLPVLFCDRAGSRVAAAHAGWKGLAAGVLEATVARLDVAPGELLAWLGPAIGPRAYEVGAEVREAFVTADAGAAAAFAPTRPGHWLCDLYALARRRLRGAGVEGVYGGEFCTLTDAARFYSFRRERVTGRMASLIWLR